MTEGEFLTMISDVCDYGQKLKPHELNYVLMLNNYDFNNVTPKQIETLQEIYRKRVE